MCPRTKKDQHDDMVAVVYARDVSEADYYRVLLEDHEIPVVIAEVDSSSGDKKDNHGIPVLVSEEYLAEAQDIIEQRVALDEEFDMEPDDYDDEDDEMDDYEGEDGDLGGVGRTDDLDDEDYI